MCSAPACAGREGRPGALPTARHSRAAPGTRRARLRAAGPQGRRVYAPGTPTHPGKPGAHQPSLLQTRVLRCNFLTRPARGSSTTFLPTRGLGSPGAWIWEGPLSGVFKTPLKIPSSAGLHIRSPKDHLSASASVSPTEYQ